jgi:hypothetical protein
MTDIIEVAKKSKLSNIVDDYIDEYEFRGDAGDYSPNEQEVLLITDAIYGLLEDEALADHYRKEGEEEANKARDKLICESIIATQHDVNGRLVCDVVEMLECFNKRKAASELRAKGDK